MKTARIAKRPRHKRLTVDMRNAAQKKKAGARTSLFSFIDVAPFKRSQRPSSLCQL